MDSYLLDVMCASREYPSLSWRWKLDLPSIHVYYKMLWKKKYEDDERICNGLFALIYRILFGEEAPCLSPKGHKIVQKYGDQYMTSDGVYIRMSGSTKAPHWLPHVLPDPLLLKEISYQTYVHGVATSLHKAKKGLWPLFLYPRGFIRQKISSRPNNKLVFYPPPGSKWLLFEGMILKEN